MNSYIKILLLSLVSSVLGFFLILTFKTYAIIEITDIFSFIFFPITLLIMPTIVSTMIFFIGFYFLFKDEASQIMFASIGIILIPNILCIVIFYFWPSYLAWSKHQTVNAPEKGINSLNRKPQFAYELKVPTFSKASLLKETNTDSQKSKIYAIDNNASVKNEMKNFYKEWLKNGFFIVFERDFLMADQGYINACTNDRKLNIDIRDTDNNGTGKFEYTILWKPDFAYCDYHFTLLSKSNK